MSDFFKNNILLYSGKSQKFPLSAQWGAHFVLKEDRDYVSDLLDFAVRFDALTAQKVFCRRLVVHEAVLNAFCYGGKEPVLRAWGAKKFMQVAIKQKNDIIWPSETDMYRGTALIRRYASGIRISDDKKTLVLQFF